MEVAILITRLFLVSILAVASGAKLLNQPLTRQSLLDFGVARSWTPMLSLLLPLSELAAAALLLWPGTSWYGALSALFLILLFTAGIAYNLAIGRRPACSCFGQLRSRRIGRGTIARNVVLSLLAASIVMLDRGAPAMLHSRTAVMTSLAVLALLAILVSLILTPVWRSDATKVATGWEGRGQEASVESLPIGSTAPPFRLSSMDDRESGLAELLACGKPLIVFFLSSDCRPCFTLIPQINLWKHELGRRCSLVVITKGTSEANRRMFTKARIDATIPVLLDRHGTVAEDYKVRWTPAAVLLSTNSEIRSEQAFGVEKITALLDELIESGLRPRASQAHTE